MNKNQTLIAKAREFEPFVRKTLDTTVADLVRDLADALDARERAYTELLADYEAMKARTEIEPEWEYQWGDPAGLRDDSFDGFDHYETFEEAKAEMDQDNDYPYSRVVRRRKAGSWLPVEGEGA